MAVQVNEKTINNLVQIKKKIASAKEEQQRLNGEIGGLNKRLAEEFNCKTLAAAEKKLAAMDKEAEALQKEIETGITALREKYNV